jgi:hypothetical protein
LAGVGHAGTIPCGEPIASSSANRDGVALTRLASVGHLLAWRDNRAFDGGQTFLSVVDSVGRQAAGWPLDGFQLISGGRNSLPPFVTALGPNSAMLAWSADVGPGGARETFSAVVRWAGAGLPSPSDLVLDSVTARVGGQTPVAVVRQSEVHALVVMQDLTNRQRVLVKQVSAMNAPSTSWPAGGVVLEDDQNAFPSGLAPVAACTDDSLGALIITAGLTPIDLFHARVTYFLVRLLPNGSRDPSWPAQGRVLTTTGDEFNVQNALIPDGRGGAYFAWTSRSDDPAGPPRVMVQRVGRDGQIHPDWRPEGVVAIPSVVETYQWYPRLVGGPERIGILLEDHERIRLQALSGSGLTLPGWPDTGVVIRGPSDARAPGRTSLLADSAFTLVAVWSEWPTGPGGVPLAVYASAVDWAGNVLPGWPAGGRVLCPVERHQLLYSLASGPHDSFSIVWVQGPNEVRLGRFAVRDGSLQLGASALCSGHSVEGDLIKTRWSGQVPADLPLLGLRRVDRGGWVARDGVERIGGDTFSFSDRWPAGATTVEFRLGLAVEIGPQGFSDTLRLESASRTAGLRLSMESVQSGSSVWMFLAVGTAEEDIELQAFDITGRLIATRALGRLVTGTHRLELVLRSHRQGIVFVRARSRSSASVARATLLR